MRGIPFDRQLRIPVSYKGIQIDCSHRIDLLVRKRTVVEVKAVENLLPIHEAQVLTYLKLTGLPTGLLVNFNVAVLRAGLRRLTRKPLATFPPSCDLLKPRA